MPYQIKKQGDKWCVFKKGTGKNEGCSDTESKALAHMRALYANENKDLTLAEVDELVKEAWRDFCIENDAEYDDEFVNKSLAEEMEDKDYYAGPVEVVPSFSYAMGATSYAELEAAREAREMAWKVEEMVADLPSLVRNILGSPDIDNKDDAIMSVAQELADRLPEAIREEKAKRDDVSEADRKRAVAEYGNVTYADPANKKYPIDTPAHIRAAWSYINMPKNAGKYSSSQLSAVKSRIVKAWKAKIDKNGPPKASNKGLVDKAKEAIMSVFSNSETGDLDFEDSRSFLVTKNSEGQYVWFSRYSNKWRDKDVPPEIISSDSHRRFSELVNKGLAPMPRLWLWHIKEWDIGYAAWHAYDDAGFPMAGGFFKEGCEQVAEWLSEQPNLGVSHGMPKDTLRRDYDDPTIIVEHETREISALPAPVFAANQLADFVAFSNKEDDMAITKQDKEDFLAKLGLDPAVLDKVEALNMETAKEADAAGLESKEAPDAGAAPETANAEPAPEPTGQEPPQADQEPELDEQERILNEPPSRKEVAEAFGNLFKKNSTETEAAIKAVSDEVADLRKQIADLKALLTKSSTPASLAALLTGSAIGDEAAAVGDGESLKDKKPKETKPTKDEGPSGIPFIDEFLVAN